MIAAAAALFAACSNTDTFKEVANEEVAIDFANGYIGKETKAELNNAWFTQDNNNFGVYGFKGSTAIFTNEEVKWVANDNDWKHNTKRFWDKASSAYEFYAYAPYGQTAEFTNKKFGFTNIAAAPIVDILTANADLAIATPMTGISYDHCTKKTTAGHGDGHVEFIFNHVLSKLSFYVKTNLNVNTDGTTGDVKELKVNAISLDFPTATSASWAQSNATGVSGSVTYNGYTVKDGIGSDGKEIPANYETVVLSGASTDVTTTATQIGKTFIVAPVNTVGNSTEHIFGVKVDYTITYNDDVSESSTAYGTIGGGNGTTGTQYKPAENTNYGITLNINPQAIEFCVNKIEDWATETTLATDVK